MGRLLTFAFAAASMFFASSAQAEMVCAPGDRAMGPNCVHEERTKATDSDFEWIYSQVYRLTEWHIKQPVWDGDIGEVVYSTDTYLAVRVTVLGRGGGPSEEVVTFTWNGTKYE